jgi:hypothetical protein
MLVRANYPELLACADAIDLSAAVNRHQNAAWSLHWLVGSSHSAQFALLALMGLCALCVAVGYRTPISTMLLLVFTVSLHNSNPLIIDTGDRQLATALLWACLLPVGRVWSMDQLLRPAEATAAKPMPNHAPGSTWAQLGYIAQTVLLYWMAASHKSLQGWLIDGSAVWFAFNIDIFTWPAASQLLAFPALL